MREKSERRASILPLSLAVGNRRAGENRVLYSARFPLKFDGDYSMITRISTIVVAALLLLVVNACHTNPAINSSAPHNNHSGTSSTPDQFASARGIYEKQC